MSGLAAEIRSLSRSVESGKPSTVNWRPIEAVLAESLRRRPEDIYGSTVSKSGNLTVRFGQSPRARAAPVFLAMFTGPQGDLLGTVEAAAKHGGSRDLVLVFVDGAQGMDLAAIVKPAASSVDATLASEYPGASVVDFH